MRASLLSAFSSPPRCCRQKTWESRNQGAELVQVLEDNDAKWQLDPMPSPKSLKRIEAAIDREEKAEREQKRFY